jgi:riboflavin kinase/FMN adenylyltransferase
VNEGTRPNLEVHVLEGAPNLYGQRIDVHFLHRLRGERKFASLEELRAAIHADFASARAWFAGDMTRTATTHE